MASPTGEDFDDYDDEEEEEEDPQVDELIKKFYALRDKQAKDQQDSKVIFYRFCGYAVSMHEHWEYSEHCSFHLRNKKKLKCCKYISDIDNILFTSGSITLQGAN